MATSEHNTLIKLVEIEGKGKGLVAIQPLKGGQIILQESPILTFSAFPLNRHHKEATFSFPTYCSHCYRGLNYEGFSCPSCSHNNSNDTIFCSSKCKYLASTTTHTPWVCEAFTQLRNCSLLLDHQHEECQVQARYLVAAYNLAINSPSTFKNLLSLHGDNKKDMENAKFLHKIISLLQFPKGFSLPSLETTISLLNKESCNSFCLMEPFIESGKRSPRAYGIYYNASFFNHDCLPNACRFDYLDNDAIEGDRNTDIIIRMIHDVPQGEEICLSYFRVGLSYEERRKRLMDWFGFVCFCDRCKVEIKQNKHESYGVDDYDCSCVNKFFERFLCEKENCGGTLAPLAPSNDNLMEVMECNFCGGLKNKRQH